MKIINMDKLFEAQKLLEEVYLVDDEGIQQIKFIYYETFSAKQANKKKIITPLTKYPNLQPAA